MFIIALYILLCIIGSAFLFYLIKNAVFLLNAYGWKAVLWILLTASTLFIPVIELKASLFLFFTALFMWKATSEIQKQQE